MLSVQQITKRFGHQTAVNQASFRLNPGEVLGLIGQNGAGKTTTFRMILGFLTPDDGQIEWDGQPMAGIDHHFIGYLPEERGLYPKMTIENQILFFGQLHGMKRRDILSQLDIWMKRFEVKGKRTDKIKDLSKGNQQKVQLIAALIHMPKLAILDEPFSGLDPVNAGLLESGIHMLQKAGTAIIFSSHDMRNVAELSDRILMLRDGRTVLSGTVEDIQNQYGRTRILLEHPALNRAELATLPGVSSFRENGDRYTLILKDEAAGKTIFEKISSRGYIQTFSQQAPSLDEIFRMKVGEAHV
ncbi:Vitamin B12 import ATP-binding protein BtuD [Lentilactobacillus hilgardii]|uniref:ABC transporter ATP-binding protein n=1 Tax=Lentilactobacillus hilgardii TaxID=1588 RepID=UPI0002E2C429|nr:ABC transporter ATP-binding protein [Lentilactobacillus hilgardii]MCT3396328.1 ATP-binding cassette domain-containing protein [Lentilactobacillus hilgardii]QIR08710.1 Vitamin B12 import ATP-binding protein BtuD [Lentilactobacillus hilgardii]